MKCPLRFGMLGWLICSAVLLAQTNTSSTQQNQPLSASSGAPPSAPYKVCSQKNPPPCATPLRAVKSDPPDYSKEARKKGIQGTETLALVVGSDGVPRDITVMRGLGYGLDEEAIKAVKKWRFKPGTLEGRPVDVEVNVEVSFFLR